MTSPTVVVTGAASGIGAATVSLLARSGHRVVGLDKADAGGSPSEAVRLCQVDLADHDALAALAPTVLSDTERCYGLVNCAGVYVHGTSRGATPHDALTALSANFMPMWNSCAVFLPYLARCAGSRVVNVSSGAALRPRPSNGLYAAAKAAVVAYSKALALEWADSGVRVNTICFGKVHTPMNDQATGHQSRDERAAVDAAYAFDEIATTAEAAEFIGFLLSPAARIVTGATFATDAGRTLH